MMTRACLLGQMMKNYKVPIAVSGDFRAARALAALRRILPHIEAVSGRFVHFVEAQRELSDGELERLKGLLTYGDAADAARGRAAFMVIPRLGTISPWASKASDIVKNCGIEGVKRVERGTVIELFASQALTPEETNAAAALLHDRMTESVVARDADPAALFSELEGKPMAEVDLSAGREALVRANADMGLALSDDEIDYLFDAYR